MSNRITITIPTASGTQSFYIGRITTIAIFFILIIAPVLLMLSINNYKNNQEQIAKTQLAVTQAAAKIKQNELVIQEKAQQLMAQTEQAAREKSQLMAQIEQTALEKSQLIAQQEQVVLEKSQYILQLENDNHLLNLELAEKNTQLTAIERRIDDVESILGLSDPDSDFSDLTLEQRVDVAAINSAVRATMLRTIPNDTPMNYNRISSPYGNRLNPITKKHLLHKGIDLTCNRGEPIISAADGVVEVARSSKKGYGNFLTIRHSFGFTSSYAHLQKFKVKKGQFVRKGEVIANCGNSGNSTGPHLHYEVRFLEQPLNPKHLINWTPDNFDTLFEKEKKVNWASLVDLIDSKVRLQVNLTQPIYQDDLVNTAKNDSKDKAQVN